MSTLDLNLLHLAHRIGQDQPTLPGVHTAAPPRRPARGRRLDRLILYLVLSGNAPLSSEDQDQLLARLAQTYYKTPGSVTSAMRIVAEGLNQFLLDRNLRSASSGQQCLGLFTPITVREDHLYLAQCGPTQAFLITAKETKQFHDLITSGRGLGLGRTTPIRYFQADLNANDTLVLSAKQPPAWNSIALRGLHGQSLESLRHHLLRQSDPDLSTLLIQANPGTGRMRLLQPKSAIRPLPTKTETADKTRDQRVPFVDPLAQASGGIPSEAITSVRSTGDALLPEEQPTTAGLGSPADFGEISGKPPGQAEGGQRIIKPPARRKIFAPIFKILSAITRALGNTLGTLVESTSTLIKRMLPGEALFTLPSSVMIFFAVAVPLVIVTIATVVYLQRGRASQYQVYYDLAVQAVGEAQTQTNPMMLRDEWEIVAGYLDQAESYDITPDSQALRTQAQLIFDNLDGVTRLDYQPAITGEIPTSFQITRIVSANNDLYLLNNNGGNVWRVFSVERGYEHDETYQCGPSSPGSQGVGPLIDIVSLAKGNELDVTLLAMDADGNLLQCIPGKPPEFRPLAPPPAGWDKPLAFTLNLGHLYVLDPQNNAVWIYWDSNFNRQPQLFFAEDIPPMKDVVDLAVDKSDLYLLHTDGHITMCTYSDLNVSPTRCIDHVPYIDSRIGRENQPLIPEPAFTQILPTQPPDPSLYLLDPETQAIYHFSLRLLTLHHQYRPQNTYTSTTSDPSITDKPATAFTFSPDARIAFLAVGNRVFYAGIP